MNRRCFLRNVSFGAASAPVALLGLPGCRPAHEPDYRFDPDTALHTRFSGDRAYEHVAAQVAFGPRPAGSRALERTAAYIEDELQRHGWVSRRQTFEEETPLGRRPFTNLRFRFPSAGEDEDPWERTVSVLVGSHYETKFYEDIRFVGANDGASSSGILIEIARVTAANPALARRLELVFFDGEEAMVDFTATDGLYGSRHYARTLIRRQPPRHRPRAVVILDLLGEKDLTVRIPPDTPTHLREALFRAAADLGHASYFGIYPTPITDDHVPFRNEGVPAINLIDLDYDAWHTSRDTMARISRDSLAIAGTTSLLLLEKYLLAP